MPRLTRRSFAALIPALAASPVMAQDATPEPSTTPQEVLLRYVTDVWNAGDVDAIADYFDPDSFNLLDEKRKHEIILDGLRPNGSPVQLATIATGGSAAIGYGSLFLDGGEEYDLFIAIWINGDGEIIRYRWMGQPEI